VTNDTDSFVQEVDETLRNERMLNFAKKWGPWLIGAFVVLLLGVIAWQVWGGVRTDQARAHAEEYAAAQELVQGGDLAGAKAAFASLSEEGPQQYRNMARLEHAAILQIEGDLEGAIAEFDAVAEDVRDPVMRDTARMRAAYLAADTQDFAALQQRLGPLIESESRLSYLARELLGFEAMEAGQNDLAREQFESLTLAFDAPEAVRQRAQMGLAVLGPAPATSADGANAPAPSEGETK
jgi:hypothetical protein